MILTKKDTFLPYEAMNDKEAFKKHSIKYRGMPIWIKHDMNGKMVEKRGLLTGLGRGAGGYWVKIESLDSNMPGDTQMQVFHNDWSDIKIDFRGGIEEVRLGNDVPLTQDERRFAIHRVFKTFNR